MPELIDIHRHLWAKDWFPPSHLSKFSAEGIARASGRRMEDVLERIYQSPTMEATGTGAMQEMEHYGIDVSIIQTLDWGLRYGPEEDNEVPAEEFNWLTQEVCKKYPGKLYAMASYDPRRPKCVALFEKTVKDWGAVGLKMYPPNGYQANDPSCWPMYKKAAELNVPVLIHTGNGTQDTWPEWVEEVGRLMPEVRIILGHTNLQVPFETGAYWRGMQAVERLRNVWLDLCDWQALGAVKDENIPELLKVIRVFINRKGADRILWGTDLPQAGVGHVSREQTEKWVDIFKNLPEWGDRYGIKFTEEERDMLCSGAAKQCFSNIDWPS
jgi:predicted TIM-barrel fold metal-dependent hydrolase